jgi:POTRA domain, FtsQ-type
VATVFTLSVVLGLAVGGGEALFALRELRVVSPDPTLAAEVAGRLTIPAGANLLTTPIARFARAAEQCPRVARAGVERKLPGRVIVTVQPRKPLLALAKGAKYLLVDREGVCLYWCTRPAASVLRVQGWFPEGAGVGRRLQGEWLERTRDVAEALVPWQKLRPWGMDATNPPELTLVSGSGAQGVVGVDGDTTRRARLFAEVLQQLGARGYDVGRIELRTRRPIWWPRGGPRTSDIGLRSSG